MFHRVDKLVAFITLAFFYSGNASMSKPGCRINTDCNLNEECIHQKCQDPCPGTCGDQTICHKTNHIAKCSCKPGYSGDPYTGCKVSAENSSSQPNNPCISSHCGPHAGCKDLNGEKSSCSCLDGYTGSPPNCKLE